MENALRAGMGTRAAMKKAIMLLMEVRATLVPVLRRQSPVRSCGRGEVERRGEERGGEERRRVLAESSNSSTANSAEWNWIALCETVAGACLEGDVGSSLREGVSQQEHVIHSNPQGQKRKHLTGRTSHTHTHRERERHTHTYSVKRRVPEIRYVAAYF